MIDDMPTYAMFRYSAVIMGVIDKCQQDFLAGRDLNRSIPGISATKAAIITTESLALVGAPSGDSRANCHLPSNSQDTVGHRPTGAADNGVL